jgi:hypothetical protein
MLASETSVNPKSRWFRINREELYEKVWSAPMIAVAKEIGISDRGLAKAAARIEVPVPPLGYWAKLKWGKTVARIPLPPAKPTTKTEIEIDRWTSLKASRNAPHERDADLQAKIDAAVALAQPLKLPRSLSNPHSVVRKWIDENRSERTRAQANVYSYVPPSITASKTGRRRLMIISAILREFERLGYAVGSENRDQEIVVRANMGVLKFKIHEPIRRMRIPLTPREKKHLRTGDPDWKFERRRSGELVFSIDSYLGDGERTEWRDKEGNSLEGQIDEIMPGLLTAIVLLEDREEKRRAEEQRRWRLEAERAELERQRKLEEDRWKRLVEFVEAALQRKRVREFLDALEPRLLTTPGEAGLSPSVKNWFEWARKRSDEDKAVINFLKLIENDTAHATPF